MRVMFAEKQIDYEPLGLLYLSSVLRAAGHEVRLAVASVTVTAKSAKIDGFTGLVAVIVAVPAPVAVIRPACVTSATFASSVAQSALSNVRNESLPLRISTWFGCGLAGSYCSSCSASPTLANVASAGATMSMLTG